MDQIKSILTKRQKNLQRQINEIRRRQDTLLDKIKDGEKMVQKLKHEHDEIAKHLNHNSHG